MTDSNWVAVNELVLSGLRDYDVLAHPPGNEQEVGFLAETITDHVAAGVELSREQKRSAKQRWRDMRRQL